MNSGEEKERALRSQPQGNLESPFLEEELFVGEAEAACEARLAALEAESPFRSAFEERPTTTVEPEELEDELVEEDEWSDMDESPPDEAETHDEEEPPYDEGEEEALSGDATSLEEESLIPEEVSEQGERTLEFDEDERVFYADVEAKEDGEEGAYPPEESKYQGEEPSLDLAERRARAGEHKKAFDLFRIAYQLLQMQIVRIREKRAADFAALEQARKAGDAAKVATVERRQSLHRSLTYASAAAVYDRMRRIFEFYPALSRERTAAGKDYDGRHIFRYGKLLVSYLESSLRPNEGNEVMIAEVSSTTTKLGPGFTLHGANLETTDVTALPGLPSPKEIGMNAFQLSTLSEVHRALSAQAAFMHEILSTPEVGKEFAGTEIDTNNVADRLRLWDAMYRAYTRTGKAGGALRQLMALIGRYLRAFTVHTWYNMRDFGANYLDSVFPTDLLRRAERDCGVYALTVAYEVYRTARSPKVDVDFDLVAVTDHVSLIVYDRKQNEHYVVNNDEVTPARTGNPLESMFLGSVGGWRFGVTPGTRLPVKSGTKKFASDLGDKEFKDTIWSTYLDSTSWWLEPDKTLPRKSKESALEATFRHFYENVQKELTDHGARLSSAVSALSARMKSPDAATKAKLAALVSDAQPIMDLVDRWAVKPKIEASASRKGVEKRLQGHQIYMHSGKASAFPVVRLAMAFLRFKSLGGTLDASADAVIQWCDGRDAFKPALDDYRAAKFPKQF